MKERELQKVLEEVRRSEAAAGKGNKEFEKKEGELTRAMEEALRRAVAAEGHMALLQKQVCCVCLFLEFVFSFLTMCVNLIVACA